MAFRATKGIAWIAVVAVVSASSITKPANAEPKPADLLRATSVTTHETKYYGPADPGAVGRCLQLADDLKTQIQYEYRTCRAATYAVGNRLPLIAIEVRVSALDRGYFGEDIRDIALLAADKVAKDAGQRFLIRTTQHEYATCSGVPVATTSATISGNSISGTTTIRESAHCALLYVTTFLAFEDYRVIREGVLAGAKDGKGTLDSDLYYDIADNVANASSGDSGRTENFRGHPLNAWRSYLPVNETYAAVIEKYRLREPINVTVKAPPVTPQREQSIEGRLAIRDSSRR